MEALHLLASHQYVAVAHLLAEGLQASKTRTSATTLEKFAGLKPE